MLKAVDLLFCGAGGTPSGLLQACGRLSLEVDLLAINHWKVAVATHTLNHPGIRHLCEDLATVDPRRAASICSSPRPRSSSSARTRSR